MSIYIQNFVYDSTECDGLVTQQSSHRGISLTKGHWFWALMFSMLLARAYFWNHSRVAGVAKQHDVLFHIDFYLIQKFTHRFKKLYDKLTMITTL